MEKKESIRENRNKEISNEIQLLKKYYNYKNIILHSITTAKIAEKIARKIKEKNPKLRINLEEIRKAALLHDIDKALTLKKNYKKALLVCKNLGITKSKIKHGVLGAEILKREGLKKYSKICSQHPFYKILSKSKKPIEFKIIYYADKIAGDGRLVDINKKIRVWIKRYNIKESEIKRLKRALLEFKKIEQELMNKTGLNKKDFYEMLKNSL
ncbi:MAG: HDIG domain-containing protein [Candidatus Woesearchaeota archaeon]